MTDTGFRNAAIPATTSRDRWPTAALAAAATLVYLATLSRNFSGDAVRYAIKAETQGLLASRPRVASKRSR